MKRLRKIIRILDRIENLVVFLCCVGLFLVGAYGLYDSYMVYQQANDDSILKYKPGYEGEMPEKEITGNMVAWLTIDGTGIDYPVMQGDTNYEYLNTNPYGEYSLSGSIFLDSRNSPDFMDDYSLIYGHHMENGYMFGALDQFMDEEYFKEHQRGTLIVDGVEYVIRFFAVLEVDATEEYIFAPGSMGKEEVVEKVKENAGILNLEVAEEKGKLIALSTCKYPATTERMVVIGNFNR